MRGTITTRSLLEHASLIVREFGVLAYVRCLARAALSRRPVTFLEVVLRLSD
jgi:hypothetical protein